MDRRQAGLAVLVGVGVLAVAAGPAAAADTTTEDLIRTLNQELLVVAIPITVLVEGILVYAVLRFRDSDEAKPTRENRRLEITWTVATAIILLFVGVASYGVLASDYVSPTPDDRPGEGDVQVNVVAAKYIWQFDYPGYNVSTTNTLVIPEGREVYFNITSQDWLHAFHVPQMGLKSDAIPGKQNWIHTRATTSGQTFQGYCAEYCGVGHSSMLFTVEVVSQAEFEEWIADQRNATGG